MAGAGRCIRDNEGSCAALGRALAVDAHGWPGGGVGPNGPGTGRCRGDRTSPDQGDPAEAGVHQQAHPHPGGGVRRGQRRQCQRETHAGKTWEMLLENLPNNPCHYESKCFGSAYGKMHKGK